MYTPNSYEELLNKWEHDRWSSTYNLCNYKGTNWIRTDNYAVSEDNTIAILGDVYTQNVLGYGFVLFRKSDLKSHNIYDNESNRIPLSHIKSYINYLAVENDVTYLFECVDGKSLHKGKFDTYTATFKDGKLINNTTNISLTKSDTKTKRKINKIIKEFRKELILINSLSKPVYSAKLDEYIHSIHKDPNQLYEYYNDEEFLEQLAYGYVNKTGSFDVLTNPIIPYTIPYLILE